MKIKVGLIRAWVPIPRRFWTPKYIVNRLRWVLWQHRHPDAPWLVPEAVRFLDQWLRPTDVLVEFGSGRSTLWFARRAGRIISVDHDRRWYERVRGRIGSVGASNVDSFLADPAAETYIAAAETALDGPADVILVDGACRDACAVWALDRLRPGGLIIVDNANWYLPCNSSAPASLGPDAELGTADWRYFWKATSRRRRLWFSNGVADTLILFGEAGPHDVSEGSRTGNHAGAD